MGSVYRRSHYHCVTCNKRLDRTSARDSHATASHSIEKRQAPTWWLKYRSRQGIDYSESSGSDLKKDALALLRKREGDIVAGKPVTSKVQQVKFEECASDVMTDYRINGHKSLDGLERRLRLHLAPHFGGWKMVNITTAEIKKYIEQRMSSPKKVANAEINRELATLNRMFTLALENEKLLHRPIIKRLPESPPRAGFFEAEQLESVLSHLPDEIQFVIRFASITGWRINSEVLPLQWRQVDFAAGQVRLDAGTTKNQDGRVFPMTTELRSLLESRHAEYRRLAATGVIFPYVFFREGPTRITSFRVVWKSATRAAGCPGRIPHDLRRTAVRNLVRAGISEQVAMKLTGHRTRSVFDRYDIVSERDFKEAAKKLDAFAV